MIYDQEIAHLRVKKQFLFGLGAVRTWPTAVTGSRHLKLAVTAVLLLSCQAACAGEHMQPDFFIRAVLNSLVTAVILTVQLVYALGLPRASWKIRISLTLLVLAVDLATGFLLFALSGRYSIPLGDASTFMLGGVPGFVPVALVHLLLIRRRKLAVGIPRRSL
jgi:hypothetical protein